MPKFNKNTTLSKIMKVHIYVCVRVLTQKENKIRNIKSEGETIVRFDRRSLDVMLFAGQSRRNFQGNETVSV